jgi:hypothetical protein
MLPPDDILNPGKLLADQLGKSLILNDRLGHLG